MVIMSCRPQGKTLSLKKKEGRKEGRRDEEKRTGREGEEEKRKKGKEDKREGA